MAILNTVNLRLDLRLDPRLVGQDRRRTVAASHCAAAMRQLSD
ncbi:hypothetical protein PSAC2689_130064 [Paraburkholderia sacchari]